MSAMLELWMGEIEKLKEKAGARRKPFLSSKPKKGQVDQQEEEAELKEARNENKEAVTETKTLSEDIICLLMDRFAPC
ncbi:Stress-induced protein [Quillaja saponaria]|uniref:Stress-induced protein n=1 Tax=Quillaja saponaria TaxID=32244 RepID=A0AAD7KW21_QUISA|nr:Stress-induced protein [Quillaja saponaria]